MIPDLPAAAAALREWVLPASIQAAALLLVVLLADALLRGRASPRLRAALWWVLVLRLLLPPTLAAPWSLDLLAPSGGGGGTAAPAAAPSILLPALWAAGAAVVLVGSLLSARRTRARLLDPAAVAEAPAGIREALAAAAPRAGLRGAPPILLSRRLRAPAVLGLLRPVVLFPADFAGSPAEARLALLHECLHLRRRDPAAAALLAAVRVIWWFHPAAWLAERRLGALRESCCDADAAALLGGEAPRYREALLAAARRRLGGEGAPAGALALLGAGEGLPERIRALEGRAWSRRCGSRAASGAAAAALAVLALPLLPSGGRAPLPPLAEAASAPLPAPAGGRRAVPGLAPGAVERARTLLEGAARGEREACIGLRWAAMAVAAEEGSLPSR